ncbi:hypothetical protein PsYK624_073800 [Phanerochaete sordida]|uniref:Uncharacterized protein n=1 Tax=Phanerochaete sordida TaxID=48140 RepID=A0A9P3GAJ3_9APHY|nr:hypothetical protein PsYK624_073800 [Phanerochaete sordida]
MPQTQTRTHTRAAGSAAAHTFQLLAHWLAFGVGWVAFLCAVLEDVYDDFGDLVACGGEELVLLLEELPLLGTMIKLSHVVSEHGYREFARASVSLGIEYVYDLKASYIAERELNAIVATDEASVGETAKHRQPLPAIDCAMQ